MRRTATIAIDDGSRDHDKMFLVTEMPAAQAERWAMRAFLALSRSGIDIPEELADAGLAGIASVGLKAFAGVSWSDMEPLVAEMFECVKIIRDRKHPEVVASLVSEDDIEEITTRLKLRKAIFELHTNFLRGAVESGSAGSPTTTPAADLHPIKTSRAHSRS